MFFVSGYPISNSILLGWSLLLVFYLVRVGLSISGVWVVRGLYLAIALLRHFLSVFLIPLLILQVFAPLICFVGRFGELVVLFVGGGFGFVTLCAL